MLSKRLARKIIQHVLKNGVTTAPPVLAALALTVALPLNVAFAADSNDDVESVVLPAETNEGSLDYLTLADYFVTAERIPTHRMDTPANVTVITAEEIENNHYQNLAEALSHVNGAIISTTNTVNLNGNRHVLLLIDGVRLNNNQDMYAADYISKLSAIPSMKMIERIEIIKGGSSALYGTNAAGGVINIITKKGTINETTVDLNFGSWNRQNYEITNQGVVENFSWFLTSGFHKSDDYKYSGGSNDTSDYKDHAFSMRLDNRFDEDNSLTFNVLYRNNKEYDSSRKEKFTNMYLSYNFKETTSTPGWFRYFNDYLDEHYINIGTARLQGFEYQNGWEIDRHKFIVGAEWHRTNADNFGFLPNLPINTTLVNPRNITNTSLYIQDTISFDDKWKFVPGLRYDHNSEYGNNWSLKAAVNYHADDKTKIYASYGKVFRAPSMAELFSAGLMTTGTSYFAVLGGLYSEIAFNESFHPEKGHTETIGFEHDLDENTSINMNFFSNKMDGVIAWTIPSQGNFPALFARNADNEKQRGLEMSFRQKYNDRFSYDAGYTHTHVENTNITRYSPNGYRLGLHYTEGALKANLLSIIAAGFSNSSSSSYVVLDCNVAYDVNEDTTIYARALNFTNKNYYHGNYYSPGRFFMIGATYKF